MRVDVLYFGILRECFGGAREIVELGDGATVSELMRLLRIRGKTQEAVWASLAVAVNREYAGQGTALKNGDEVALLPPVSGGSVSGRNQGVRCLSASDSELEGCDAR